MSQKTVGLMLFTLCPQQAKYKDKCAGRDRRSWWPSGVVHNSESSVMLYLVQSHPGTGSQKFITLLGDSTVAFFAKVLKLNLINTLNITSIK